MKESRILEIAETYINGNISDAKRAARRMKKTDFLLLVMAIATMETHARQVADPDHIADVLTR